MTSGNTTIYSVSALGTQFLDGCYDPYNRHLYMTGIAATSRGILQYNSQASFSAAGSWKFQDLTTFDAAANGYVGGVATGNHVYFSPRQSSAGTAHGNVARFDPNGSLSVKESWEFANLASLIGATYIGYSGCVFDGTYVYLIPTNRGGANWHGNAARYNTSLEFTLAASWESLDLTTVNAACVGYIGGCFDGKYIYYCPRTGAAAHGQALRFDTTKTFVAGSFERYDMTGIDANCKGYSGCAFDGRYVYYAPTNNGAYHGQVVRYDTAGSFTAAGSWATFNLATIDATYIGYYGCDFDGRYVYFSPFFNTAYHGKLLRYDIGLPFDSTAAWSVLDLNGINANYRGYSGALHDGQNVYLVPYNNSSAHGNVVKLSTKQGRSATRWQGFNTPKITVRYPKAYQVHQWVGNPTSIPVVGMAFGSPGVEARIGAGAWYPMTMKGNLFTGSIPVTARTQGTVQVRWIDETNTVSISYVAVGDNIIVLGQSNASGRATNNQAVTAGVHGLFGNDYKWRALADPVDSVGNQIDSVSDDYTVFEVTPTGSLWPGVASSFYTAKSTVLGIIPCALGATGIVSFLPGTDHADRSTLYGSMVARARAAGGVALVAWWQGETDGLNQMPRATYNAHLDTIANAVMADLGVKLMPCKLLNTTLPVGDQANIDNAIGDAWADNPNVATGPDLNSIAADDAYHYIDDATVTSVVAAWAAILNAYSWLP